MGEDMEERTFDILTSLGSCADLIRAWEETPAGVFMQDTSLALLWANRSFRTTVNCPDPDSLRHRRINDFFPAETAQLFDDTAARVMATGTPAPPTLEHILCPGSILRWMLISHTPILSQGAVTGLFTLCVDCTDILEDKQQQILTTRHQNTRLTDLPPVPAGDTHSSVLLVDDEDSLRALLAQLLEQRGYTVLAARNGGDALQMARDLDHPVDIIITDLIMGRINGTRLAASLRELWPQIPIIYISGFAEELKPLADNGEHCLSKPFGAAELFTTIEDALAS